ncbi:fluoride efflux transporter CrcB [Bacillus aerolatus]|uniref:Fluoride-specific ion channel FluC n=1 Tax=Bacillus aerolatus TaxID=2653354 RepID=A0A6I1FT04_9BACI|nr:CrcB family protein [Bacillus aerolatus]KAB7707895.1 fluoride efflux transporter CrcB [Bacillus aerolatus]
MDILFIAAGGAAGAVLRYAAGLWLARKEGRFPLGALTVNLLGSFFLGLLAGILPASGQTFAGTGLLGGFTTFSTFSVEAALLWNESRLSFFSYTGITVIGSTALFWLGTFL